MLAIPSALGLDRKVKSSRPSQTLSQEEPLPVIADGRDDNSRFISILKLDAASPLLDPSINHIIIICVKWPDEPPAFFRFHGCSELEEELIAVRTLEIERL